MLKLGSPMNCTLFSLFKLAICHTMGISPSIIREDSYYDTVNISIDSLAHLLSTSPYQILSYFCKRINSYNLTHLNIFAPISSSRTSMVPPTHIMTPCKL